MIPKKPKKIIKVGGPMNQILRPRRNPVNRYKPKSSTPAPGNVGHLVLTLSSY